jgi:hypothetical protein
MSDHRDDAPMFDYDARPVTPQIVLVGERSSPGDPGPRAARLLI